ncbi:MAG: hypothetical protein ABIH92_01225 [Nanoarchaeota archaeon]
MRRKIDNLKNDRIFYWELMESYQGWQAYAKWANSFNLRKKILKEISKVKKEKYQYFSQENICSVLDK